MSTGWLPQTWQPPSRLLKKKQTQTPLSPQKPTVCSEEPCGPKVTECSGENGEFRGRGSRPGGSWGAHVVCDPGFVLGFAFADGPPGAGGHLLLGLDVLDAEHSAVLGVPIPDRNIYSQIAYASDERDIKDGNSPHPPAPTPKVPWERKRISGR